MYRPWSANPPHSVPAYKIAVYTLLHNKGAAMHDELPGGPEATNLTIQVEGLGLVSLDTKLYQQIKRRAIYDPRELFGSVWGGLMLILSRVSGALSVLPSVVFWCVVLGLAYDHAGTVDVLTAIWTNPGDAFVAKDVLVWWAGLSILVSLVFCQGTYGSARYDASVTRQVREAVAQGRAKLVTSEQA